MGSATTHALRVAVAGLDAETAVDLQTSRELFAAAQALADTPALANALADAASPLSAREAAVATVFASLGSSSRAALAAVAGERWSSSSDLIDAVEELAIRAATIAAPDVDLESELFNVGRIVAENSDLELALGSTLGDASKKGELVATLLKGRSSEATSVIASSIVQQPRERRVRQLLSRALRIIADQRGKTVATAFSAAPLTAEQQSRLIASLTQRYGTGVALNVVIDPSVVGGIRIEIGDDVIDATISSRLADLRQKLAG